MLSIRLYIKASGARELFEDLCANSAPSKSERIGRNALKASLSEEYNSMVVDINLETEAMVSMSDLNSGSLILSMNCWKTGWKS